MTLNEEEKRVGPIGERVLKLIHYYHLNMNSLSIRLRLPSNSIITRIVRDSRRGMSLDLLQKILFEFTEISPDWLVTGRGEMLRTGEAARAKADEAPCGQCAQKDELVGHLKTIIKSKDEVISAKNDLIANLGGTPHPKQAASG